MSVPSAGPEGSPRRVPRYELAPGFDIARMITGLWQIADMERDGRVFDPAAAVQAMARYTDVGLTTFDMADHYGSAEEIAGRFRAQALASGQCVELLTKWVPKPGALTKQQVAAAVDRALERLGTERIDLLQYHAWNYADPAWLDGLFWLEELVSAGKIGHLGVTNLDTAHLRMLDSTGVDVVTNQVCCSLLDRRAQGAMSDLCAGRGVKVLAFGVLAGGFLTERWLGLSEPESEALETWSEMKYKRFVDIAGGWDALQALLEVMSRVATRHGVSMANVACRYVLDLPVVAAIIVGARVGKSQHIDDNLRAFDFAFDDEDRVAIEAAASALQPIPGDCGDEYRKAPFLTASGDLSHHLESMPTPYLPETRPGGRTFVSSGTPWEPIAGYCRAIRHGNRILVSGTTATHGDRVIGGDDPVAQTHFAIDKIEGSIQSLGGRLEDVVRTRVFIHDIDDWEAVSRAHGDRFRDILPVNTLVEARIIGGHYRVEIEAEAIIDDARRP